MESRLYYVILINTTIQYLKDAFSAKIIVKVVNITKKMLLCIVKLAIPKHITIINNVSLNAYLINMLTHLKEFVINAMIHV